MNIRRFKIFGPSASILVLTGQQSILLNLIFVRFQVKQAVVIVEPYGWIFIHSINRFFKQHNRYTKRKDCSYADLLYNVLLPEQSRIWDLPK